MSTKNYDQKDFQLIPFLNSVAEPVAGSITASTANVGRFYRNTMTGYFEIVINSTTVGVVKPAGTFVDSDIAAGAAIANSKLATNPLDRNNHINTQLANTISNFDVAVRTSRLDQMAAPTAAVAFNGQRATGLSDPTAAQDAATMNYVANALAAAINGHDYKDAARVLASSNVTITAPGANVDGVAMGAGDRVLLAAQTDGTQNGLWNWNGSGTAMTRTTDADTSAKVTNGMAVDITAGTSARNRAILTTPDVITLGTTALTFQVIPVGQTYVAGTGITITGNTIAITSPVAVANGGTGAATAAAARTNLGTNASGNATVIGALAAGSEVTVTHNLNTTLLILQVVDSTTREVVSIKVRPTGVNTAGVTADVAVAASALTLLALPIGA